MIPSEKIFDREWSHTICGNCAHKGGHTNTLVCPQCGLDRPKPCKHKFRVIATASGSSDPNELRLTQCSECGQMRSHPIPVVKPENDPSAPFAALYVKAADILKQPKAACPHQWVSQHGGELTTCVDCGKTVKVGAQETKVAQGDQFKEYLKSFTTAGQPKKPPKEDVICPHCGAGFKVIGDIKTWDTVYTTCMDCYTSGHRKMPAKCGACTKEVVWFAREIAEETPKSIQKAEVDEAAKDKFPRNIVL